MLREEQGGLSPAELRGLSRLSATRTWLRIAEIYAALTLLFIAVTVVGTWWAWLLAVPLVARYQMAMGALMHDAAHRRLFASRRLNDTVSQLFVAGPLLLVSDGYRRTHLKHHRAPLASDDPDIGITGGYPISRLRLAKRFFRDMTGQTYIKFIRHFIAPHRRTADVANKALTPRKRNNKRDDGVPMWLVLLGILAVHGGVIALLTVFSTAWLYPLLWLIPQMTALQVYLRIRGISEHAGFSAQDDQRMNTRTVLSRWQAWWVAPGQLNYHITHHLYPSIPWYRTRQTYRMLQERGALDGTPVYDNYGQVLRELTTTAE